MEEHPGHAVVGNARIMTTLVNALEQRGKRYGLQTMREGAGRANRPSSSGSTK
jgi:Thiolase, C-terminal domain